MKLIVHPTDGTEPVVIHDQNRNFASSGLRFGHSRQVDVRSPFRGASIEIMNRGDTGLKHVTASWITVREHDDEMEAELFCAEHGTILPVVADVEMVMSGSNGAEKVRWIKDCGIVGVQADDVKGITSYWSYSITYGKLLTERPTHA